MFNTCCIWFDRVLFSVWHLRFYRFILYTTQKKFRISCAYFFVLSTLNSCRLWKGLTDQGTIFRGCFLHDHLQFLWKAIRSKWHIFNCSKTTFLTQKYNTSLILCLINIFTTIVWIFFRIDTMLAVLSCFIQQYPHQKPANFRKLWLSKNRCFTPCT